MFTDDTGKVIQDQRELDSEYDKTFQLQALSLPFLPVSPPSYSWNSGFSSGPSVGTPQITYACLKHCHLVMCVVALRFRHVLVCLALHLRHK